jgi:hypothetical protein
LAGGERRKQAFLAQKCMRKAWKIPVMHALWNQKSRAYSELRKGRSRVRGVGLGLGIGFILGLGFRAGLRLVLAGSRAGLGWSSVVGF